MPPAAEKTGIQPHLGQLRRLRCARTRWLASSSQEAGRWVGLVSLDKLLVLVSSCSLDDGARLGAVATTAPSIHTVRLRAHPPALHARFLRAHDHMLTYSCAACAAARSGRFDNGRHGHRHCHRPRPPLRAPPPAERRAVCGVRHCCAVVVAATSIPSPPPRCRRHRHRHCRAPRAVAAATLASSGGRRPSADDRCELMGAYKKAPAAFDATHIMHGVCGVCGERAR